MCGGGGIRPWSSEFLKPNWIDKVNWFCTLIISNIYRNLFLLLHSSTALLEIHFLLAVNFNHHVYFISSLKRIRTQKTNYTSKRINSKHLSHRFAPSLSLRAAKVLIQFKFMTRRSICRRLGKRGTYQTHL